jgi:transcriptional regulator with XRE-family HTH domain
MGNLRDTGRRIAALRTGMGLGQAELAAEIGVTRSAIANVETGGDRAGILLLTALADYFKVPLDWLVGRRVPPGGPVVGQFVNDADELAWVDFWRKLNDADRASATRLLNVPGIRRDAA